MEITSFRLSLKTAINQNCVLVLLIGPCDLLNQRLVCKMNRRVAKVVAEVTCRENILLGLDYIDLCLLLLDPLPLLRPFYITD